MTLADVALIAEIVGVTGILISLFFVLRQLRLANDQLEKAQSANRIAVEMAASIPTQNVFLARAQDAELSNLILCALRGERPFHRKIGNGFQPISTPVFIRRRPDIT